MEKWSSLGVQPHSSPSSHGGHPLEESGKYHLAPRWQLNFKQHEFHHICDQPILYCSALGAKTNSFSQNQIASEVLTHI